jgi:hypothetical protein
VSYTTFIDGVQTVLLLAADTKIIEAASGVCLLNLSFLSKTFYFDEYRCHH